MKLTDYRSSDLEKAIGLLKRKEVLETELAAVKQELAAIEVGQSASASLSTDSADSLDHGRKNVKLKGGILDIIQTAGPEGVEISALAEKLGVKITQVSTWFATTGKKYPEIQKLERGRFCWTPAPTTAPVA